MWRPNIIGGSLVDSRTEKRNLYKDWNLVSFEVENTLKKWKKQTQFNWVCSALKSEAPTHFQEQWSENCYTLENTCKTFQMMPCQCRKICFLVLKPRFPCQGEKKEGRQRHLYQILRRLSLNHLKYVASSQKLGSGISLALGWSLKLIPCLVTVFFLAIK